MIPINGPENGFEYEKELSRIYDRFNRHFWDDFLPPSSEIIITFAPTKKAHGHITTKPIWASKEDNKAKYELNISALTIGRDKYEICATILHEQCHLFNILNEVIDCSASGYHTKEFEKTAESHGLIVKKSEHYGFSLTELNEESKKYVDTLKVKNFKFQRYKEAKPNNNLIKYTCPLCQRANVYVGRNTRFTFIKCGYCNTTLEPYKGGINFDKMDENNKKHYKNRIVIFTDGGLDDAIALQYLFSNTMFIHYLDNVKNCIDIRCVSGCVNALQTYKNTIRVLKSTRISNTNNNIYVTCSPAPYDDTIEPWDGYGHDGVLSLFDNITNIDEYPSINYKEEVSGDSISILLLSPFTHAFKFLEKHYKQVYYIVAMGGNESEVSKEDIEFNESLDTSAFMYFNRICKRENIFYSLITMEECQRSDRILIDIDNKLQEFYSKFKKYCDAYTDRMKELGLNTTCYDLVATIKFAEGYH